MKLAYETINDNKIINDIEPEYEEEKEIDLNIQEIVSIKCAIHTLQLVIKVSVK